ncbi:MAG: hypothetical protein KDA89_10845 [Planctomycetaceae bacterium]|nr:hypothetical protein [Planctomycetaceae bacterium]
MVIVIALLGLLAFTGMLFFTFAAQERQAAEYFSEAAKAQYSEPADVWPHMLEQVIVGAPENYRGSILYSPSRRHSLVRNLVGTDISPHSGDGVEVSYSAGFPVSPDSDGLRSMLEFVDSPAAYVDVWETPQNRKTQYNTLMQVRGFSGAAPTPDVDYTYPDINNLFLAYKGWAIRDNGSGATPRYTQVPVIIPSYFRPQYMRQDYNDTGPGLSLGPYKTFGTDTAELRTNPHWAYAYEPGTNPGDPPAAGPITNTNRDTVLFPRGSFRPHPSHIAGITDNGAVTRRYLTDAEATSLGIAAGGFTFLPEDDNNNGVHGDLGIWTAAVDPGDSSAMPAIPPFFDANAYELDFDNDGDGIKEGILIDLHFPVQEVTDTNGNVRKYVVLHSATIYDLDGLFNVNVHGNLAGMPRTYETTDALGNTVTANHTLLTLASQGVLTDTFLSESHHGLGPNEVNPQWGLRRLTTINTDAQAHMFRHFGGVASQTVEQANMEWIWLLMGRGKYDYTVDPMNGSFTFNDLTDLFGGRWGDKHLLYNSLELASTPLQVVDLPRPGRAGSVYDTVSAGNISFGGRAGVDDNQNALEGEAFVEGGEVIKRPFGHPMSWSGRGRRTDVNYPVFNSTNQTFEFTAAGSASDAPPAFAVNNSPMIPFFLRDSTDAGPMQWPAYFRYGAASTMNTTTPKRYVFGRDDNDDNGTNAVIATGGSDDLNYDPTEDELFEDPLETIFDDDKADRVRDGIAAIGDTVALQWQETATNKIADAKDTLSQHMMDLAPHAFHLTSGQREMFTTYSNTLRYIAMQRNSRRSWEYTADTDGADQNGDGLPDGDGLTEFPPKFGAVDEFSAEDPFRPQVRRILTNEAGENRDLIGALPISINHLLDVDRTDDTPADGTVPFFRYLQRSGLRFRPLTEHPHSSQTAATASESVLDATTMITLELPGSTDTDTNTVASEADVAYPPQTVAQQEFWARRDRQQLARDIYVLLYTLGGAELDGSGNIKNYTGTNDPSAAAGSATSLYTHEQCRRMAQFAVNLVDAMDADNVITKFEYDKNLGNGWNLDDDAFSQEATPSTANAVTNFGMYPEDGTGTLNSVTVDRGVVYGVEAQELAFSEILAIACPQISTGGNGNGNANGNGNGNANGNSNGNSNGNGNGQANGANNVDHPATLHDDSSGERHHLFIELQNLSPNTLELATTASVDEKTGIFRIARFDRAAATDPHSPMATPTGGTFPVSAPTAAVTLNKDVGSVVGGGTFTIATASDASVICSDFFVDYDLDTQYDLIAPDTGSTNLPSGATSLTDPNAVELKPRCDLDLIHTDHATSRYTLTDNNQTVPTTPQGAFLNGLTGYSGNQAMIDLSTDAPTAGGIFSSASEDGFDLVIQRRLNPHMPSLANTSDQAVDVNPWIEVDRIRVTFSDFGLLAADGAPEVQTRLLSNIKSRERQEPLNDVSRILFRGDAAADYRTNSIKANANAEDLQDPTQVFHATTNPVVRRELWQPHFDRDFASAGELLALPVYGPNLVTQRLNHSRSAPYQQIDGGTDQQPNRISSASAMFLRPDFDLTTATNTENDNRWYRLFQFVEVPSRVHRMLGNYITQNRVPGKINLNMIRHLEVFAGLIDDPYFADTDANNLASPFLSDGGNAGGHDRWREFLRERDGGVTGGYYDPTADLPNSGDEIQNFYIPGLPGSRPFRSFGHQADAANDNGIEGTILRRLTADRDDDDNGVEDESGVDDDTTNRHWLEVGTQGNHQTPFQSTTQQERHQMLSKILNNTTTVSNTFIVFATAAYYEAYEDPATGFVRVGGRMDLDESSVDSNPGWQQRAVFIIDRTEAYNAFDRGSGDFDWQRLVKYQAIIE